jgi:hypothetical protein
MLMIPRAIVTRTIANLGSIGLTPKTVFKGVSPGGGLIRNNQLDET